MIQLLVWLHTVLQTSQHYSVKQTEPGDSWLQTCMWQNTQHLTLEWLGVSFLLLWQDRSPCWPTCLRLMSTVELSNFLQFVENPRRHTWPTDLTCWTSQLSMLIVKTSFSPMTTTIPTGDLYTSPTFNPDVSPQIISVMSHVVPSGSH